MKKKVIGGKEYRGVATRNSEGKMSSLAVSGDGGSKTTHYDSDGKVRSQIKTKGKEGTTPGGRPYSASKLTVRHNDGKKDTFKMTKVVDKHRTKKPTTYNKLQRVGGIIVKSSERKGHSKFVDKGPTKTAIRKKEG